MFSGRLLYISTPKYKEVPQELWEARETENLTISSLKMVQIPSEIQNLTNLAKLSISENSLESIPRELHSLSKLISFDCSTNNVEAVATSTFPESLESLSFQGCKLSTFTCDAPLPNLTSLSLVEDRLPALAPAGISTFASLRSLNLSYNKDLEELPPSFSELRALESIKIVGCNLKVFPACLYELTNLKSVQLGANSIERFEESPNGTTVENMRALTTLDVSDNSLVELPPQLFEMSLTVVLLQANRINRLPRFGRICDTLNALDVSENYIQELPESFYDLRNIKTVNISINDIKEIDIDKITKNFGSLERLHLFGNLLKIDPSASLPPSFNMKETDCPAEISEGVYLGSYRSASNRNGMREKGITHVLSVANLKPRFPDVFTYKIIDVDDVESEDLSPFFNECVEFISAALKTGGHVLVHCSAGVSRSATICLAYLISKKRMNYEAALEHVRSLRPVVCPNSGFIQQLKDFEKSSSKSCILQ